MDVECFRDTFCDVPDAGGILIFHRSKVTLCHCCIDGSHKEGLGGGPPLYVKLATY